MATNITLNQSGARRIEYRTVEQDNCTLIFGELPAMVATRLFSGFPKGAVLDPDLARMMKASFAIGLPVDTKRLREAIADDVIARTRADFGAAGLSEAAIRWLAVGEQGASSRFMFATLACVDLQDAMAHPHHPCDPDDLRRCRLLLESVPEFQAQFPKMAGASQVWKELVDRWGDLCAIMDTECPRWRFKRCTATGTYELKKSLGC